MIIVCDYHSDFKKPETGVSFHYFNSKYNYLHTHNYWEVFLITSGKLNHTINGQKSVLKTRDCYIIRPSDVHVFEQIDDIQSQHINVMITDRHLQEMLNLINSNLYSALLEAKSPIGMKLTEPQFEQFNVLINKLYLNDNKLSVQSLTRFFILEAVKLAYLKNNIKLTHEEKEEVANRPDWLVKLLDRMNNLNYICLSPKEIVKDVGFSQVHVSRLFKEHMNVTLGAYFNQLKLNYACRLLETTNFTILEICSRIGYSSLSHFNRFFKEKCGCTPKEFRREHYKGATK